MWRKILLAICIATLPVTAATGQTNTIGDSVKTTFDQRKLISLIDYLSNEVKSGNAKNLGLDIVRDGRGISTLASMDLFNIQKKAMAPYLDEMCDYIGSGVYDINEMASLFAGAWEAEANATTATYEAFIAELSNEAYIEVEHLRNSKFQQGETTEIDWEKLAVNAPSVAESRFLSICGKYTDPNFKGDIPVVNEPMRLYERTNSSSLTIVGQ